MVAWKFFFLDDPSWPAPPTGAGPIPGSLMLMGIGRMVLFGLMSKELVQWILTY
jgi:hypothetical protein